MGLLGYLRFERYGLAKCGALRGQQGSKEKPCPPQLSNGWHLGSPGSQRKVMCLGQPGATGQSLRGRLEEPIAGVLGSDRAEDRPGSGSATWSLQTWVQVGPSLWALAYPGCLGAPTAPHPFGPTLLLPGTSLDPHTNPLREV